MTKEFRHKDVVSGRIREAEYEHINQHILNGQTAGTLVYAPTTTQLSGLTVGSTGQILTVVGGLPAYTSSFAVTLGFADDILFTLGTTKDIAIVNRSTVLNANTALTGVIIGTPVTPAVAANSLLISNVTASGDMLFAVNTGGHSQGLIFLDGSAGTLKFPLGAVIAASTFSADNTWSVAQTGMTLTSPTINGTIATTGLTLPDFTINGSGLVAQLALKAPLASPTFTGTVTVPATITNPSGVITLPTVAGKVAILADLHNRNIIINGGFTLNQRAYASAAALATTVYGHDRWKAGAAGGDYSFTQLASPTTITIAANKTLIQVIEDKMVYGGTYILSWTGTAQARYAVDSATPAGAYASSPITITGQTAGTTMSVEFGNGASSGTLGLVQLELGSVATPFEYRPYGAEWDLSEGYYQKNTGEAYCPFGVGQCTSTTVATIYIPFKKTMRAIPTFSYGGNLALSAANGGVIALSAAPTVDRINSQGAFLICTVAAGLTAAGDATRLFANNDATAYVAFTAEL